MKSRSSSAGLRTSYRCHLAVVREDDGTYSVLVVNLPGAGSCGDTKAEAIANAREAVLGVIESYLEDNVPIPWLSVGSYPIPQGAELEWISVDA